MIFVFLLLFCFASGQDEGEQCQHKSGASGVCVNIRSCPSAFEDIKNRRTPQTCGFSGFDVIVCCVSNGASAAPPTQRPPPPTTPRRPQATTPRRPGTTTEYTPPINDYIDNNSGTSTATCQALTDEETAKRTGRKAWDKCIEYQERLVFPCERSTALTGELTRVNHCMHSADELIIGGVDAATGEFPHMALLGFGPVLSQVKWLCGGTIISEKYILTAGHCTYTRDDGPVTYASIGILRRTDEVDSTKVYKIKNIIKHPDYKPPKKYNDIALLETEIPMKLGPYAVPACLHVGGAVNDTQASATGWGHTENRGGTSDTLQKVILHKFTYEECRAKITVNHNLKNGFDTNSQLCYGDRTMSKDTCQGDSGGPLQIKNTQIKCMYTIIGVTSFGKGCGFVGVPGVYTKVEKYTPWIESVVWPDQ